MAGRVTHFIRMGGCDYRCAWCDSGYAVLPKEVRANAEKLREWDIIERLEQLDGDPLWVTISGGNPALHDLLPLVHILHARGKKVAVETQGSIWKPWLEEVDQLTVSPKPPSSEMATKFGMSLPLLERLSHWGKVCLKVPVYDETDYEWAIQVHQMFPEVPFYFSVVTLMGGLDGRFKAGQVDTTETLLERTRWLYERIAADTRARDTVAFPQLHALVWGHGRGF